ncbi:MAG: hypothetical protein OXH86_12915 [Acidimicrobiaceae bacterium]|nr:hypothetical protein [Acidimicrobiaceae bacterium]MDE0321567.1 hypothetical protein [Acidimicrobiaceae bacterium]MDE0498245.1 hypothetical protein [Acidimicrobiaceae bacterium]
MASNGTLKVSSRGQMSLPATARHLWGLTEGGDVTYLDLGGLLLLVPGRIEQLRAELLDGITDDIWAEAAAGFGDPDLANE